MTPAQVEEAIRRRYNSVGSSFFSQDEIFKIIYEAEQILASEGLVIEGGPDTSTSTVAGTQAYAFPSLFINVKRLEYDGVKLQNIEFRQDDQLTLLNSTTTEQGTPQYYFVWNSYVYLRPIPDSAETLKFYGNKEATLLTTASSSLSIPVMYHSRLIDYGVAQLAAKDGNWQMYDRFIASWDKTVIKVRQLKAKLKRGDSFATVKDEESLSETLLGSV